MWKKLCYRFASTSLIASLPLNYLVPLTIRVPNYCDNQYAGNVNFKRTEKVHQNIGEISCARKVISCASYKEIWKHVMSYTTVQLYIAVMNNFDSALNSEHCAHYCLSKVYISYDVTFTYYTSYTIINIVYHGIT